METTAQKTKELSTQTKWFMRRGIVWIGVAASIGSIFYEIGNWFYIDWSGFEGMAEDPEASAHGQAGMGVWGVFFLSMIVLLGWAGCRKSKTTKAHLVTACALVVIATLVPLCNFGASGSPAL